MLMASQVITALRGALNAPGTARDIPAAVDARVLPRMENAAGITARRSSFCRRLVVRTGPLQGLALLVGSVASWRRHTRSYSLQRDCLACLLCVLVGIL